LRECLEQGGLGMFTNNVRKAVQSGVAQPEEIQVEQGPSADTAAAAFEFVKLLASELSSGRLDLPSFPDVAIQVRRALSDEHGSVEQVVKIVGSEAALAAKLLRIANSAALNRSGKPVTDLRTAINRMGHNMVRSAAISFAMAQIRQADELKRIAMSLKGLWEQSTHVAAVSHAVARRAGIVNPDEAMLAGLLHGLGKLYILTRATRFPELFTDPRALAEIMRDWHTSIGKSIVENWGFSPEMCAAIEQQEDYEREKRVASPDLVDVLISSVMLARCGPAVSEIELVTHDVRSFTRLGLDATTCVTLITEAEQEIAELREALAS
jgi:HD-like signal output (HDOD) protein